MPWGKPCRPWSVAGNTSSQHPRPLELYTASNFIGLLVKEDNAEVLKKFAADFAAEAASKTGEHIQPSTGP
jgi:hypothetical protein